MKKTFLIAPLLVITVLGGCQQETSTTGSSQVVASSQVQMVDAAEFDELAAQENAFVLDVHTPEQEHIAGTDEFIPYDQIEVNVDKLPSDKNAPILVYCRSGSMSARAAEEIAALGYTQVYDLEGGIGAYREANAGVFFTPETKDLGTVIYGDVERTEYTLTNNTPLPVKITRVSTSCGCTKAEVEAEELGAYESVPVKVSFDPAVHKDDTDLGQLTRTIYIETDNPNFPELEARFSANVIKES